MNMNICSAFLYKVKWYLYCGFCGHSCGNSSLLSHHQHYLCSDLSDVSPIRGILLSDYLPVASNDSEDVICSSLYETMDAASVFIVGWGCVDVDMPVVVEGMSGDLMPVTVNLYVYKPPGAYLSSELVYIAGKLFSQITCVWDL